MRASLLALAKSIYYTLQPAKQKYTCAVSKKNMKTSELAKRNAELFW